MRTYLRLKTTPPAAQIRIGYPRERKVAAMERLSFQQTPILTRFYNTHGSRVAGPISKGGNRRYTPVVAQWYPRLYVKPNLICKEFHAKGAVDDVTGGPLEAGVLDVYERWAEGVVVLELHQETNVVQALVLLQPLHVLSVTTTRTTESRKRRATNSRHPVRVIMPTSRADCAHLSQMLRPFSHRHRHCLADPWSLGERQGSSRRTTRTSKQTKNNDKWETQTHTRILFFIVL